MSKPTVLLLDSDIESQKNISFLLGIAKFQVRSFLDEDECLNWLSLVRDGADEVLAILINGEIEIKKIHEFFESLENVGHFSPVLVVNRYKSVLKKEELLKGTFTSLPVFVCESSEMLIMLNHFYVLNKSLTATNRTFRMFFCNSGVGTL